LVEVVLEHITKHFGQAKIIDDINLRVRDKEFLTLLGPSGCGKTTTLRLIAGLERVDSGTIYIDGKVVNDVPPSQRNISMVFQNYALYPFMTVRDNISFPLRLRKEPRDIVERRVKEVAEMLHVSHLLDRKPKQLSGGEQQRVAIGRALVRNPSLLLLDEPFSNLDAKLRIETRSEIKRLQKNLGITTIFVTHDQAEAMALADRIAVLDKGKLRQLGTPEEVYSLPVDITVAQFMGSPAMNVIDGIISPPDTISLGTNGNLGVIKRLEAVRAIGKLGPGEVKIGFRPEDAYFDKEATDGVPAEVYVEEPLGTHVLLTLKVGEALVKVIMPPDFRAGIGTKGSIKIREGKVHVFDKTGARVPV